MPKCCRRQQQQQQKKEEKVASIAGQDVGGMGELSAAAAGRSNLKYLRICRSSSVLEIGAYCVSAMSFHLTCHLSLGRGGSKLSLSRSRTTARQLGATQRGAARRGSSSFQLRANWSSFYFCQLIFSCLPPPAPRCVCLSSGYTFSTEA